MPSPSRQGERSARGERGNVLIFVALLMTALLGFAALVVDLGNLYRVRGELQNAADAAALAGAMELDGTAAGIASVKDKIGEPGKVNEFAGKHNANGTKVVIAESDIEFGHWSFTNCSGPACFTKIDDPEDNASSVNALRVRARRDGESAAENDEQVKFFFGSFVDKSEGGVVAQAVAVGGGPAVDCAFPMVVADCALESAIPGTGGQDCQYCMKYQDNGTDTAGWTTFKDVPDGDDNAKIDKIFEIIEQGCYSQSCEKKNEICPPPTIVDGMCAGKCRQVPIDTEIDAKNGNMLNTGNDSFCVLIQQILLRQPANYEVQASDEYNGQPFTVRVPVLRSTGETCDASQFSSWKEVAGYATMEIFGASCGDNSGNKITRVLSPLAPSCPETIEWPPPSGKYIIATLKCDLESNQPAGGGSFGTDATRVRLVR